VLDIDATLTTAHSDKEQAAGNFKGGYGHHPLLCYLDASGEGLAGVLRPGNAGSNTASDHIEVLDAALGQLDPEALHGEILVRVDGAGASHQVTRWCRDAKIGFSVGFDLDERVGAQAAALPTGPPVGADRPPRAPDGPAPRARLGLVRRARRRLRAPAGAALSRRLAGPARATRQAARAPPPLPACPRTAPSRPETTRSRRFPALAGQPSPTTPHRTPRSRFDDRANRLLQAAPIRRLVHDRGERTLVRAVVSVLRCRGNRCTW